MEATATAWTAVYERQDSGWIAYCAEHPEAGVVGHTLAEAREQLKEVMEIILTRRSESSANGVHEKSMFADRADA